MIASQTAKHLETFGLALGSGGARGLAHIGVLDTLLTRGIEPKFLAGTSMGAIVGAAYATRRFSQLKSVLGSMDIAKAAALFFDFGIGKAGIVKGSKVMEFISAVIPDVSFESLDLPFAVMATDIDSGEAVAISRGKILPAIRASISIPGVFTPVRRNGMSLVDGGLSSPVPIGLVRKLGAKKVAAVNVDNGLSCPYNTHRLPNVVHMAIDFHDRMRTLLREHFGEAAGKGPGVFDTLCKTTRICEDRLAQWEVDREKPDWIIEPEVGDIPTLDFSRIDDAIRAGADAAVDFLSNASL